VGTKLNKILPNVHECVQPHKTHSFAAVCCLAAGFNPKCMSIIRSLYKNMNTYINTVHSCTSECYTRGDASCAEISDSWQHHQVVQTRQVTEISAPCRWRRNVYLKLCCVWNVWCCCQRERILW